MLVFNCTKDAATFFSVTRKGAKVSPIQPQPDFSIRETTGDSGMLLSPWLLHAKTINRKHIIIAVEVNTRYAMVFADLKKGDVMGFIELFWERLINNMQWMGEDLGLLDEDSIESVVANFHHFHRQPPLFCQRGDRSAQANINDVFWHFDCRVYEAGGLPNNQEQAASFDIWLNRMPRNVAKVKGCIFPDEEMFVQWCLNYSGVSDDEVVGVRESVKRLRRSSFKEYE